MAKLLFVVHRYLYPGGSEYNVQRMAEEAARRGHDTTVFTVTTPTHNKKVNGVYITTDMGVIFNKWDLIIVHGSCPAQDIVHAHSDRIQSPIYYMLIQPSTQPIALRGLSNSDFIGCATSYDINHVLKHGDRSKIRTFNYGIVPFSPSGHTLREEFGISLTDTLFMSAGGFWPHKRFPELAEAFIESGRHEDSTLLLFGYEDKQISETDKWSNTIPSHPKIVKFLAQDQQHVFDAMDESDLYILNSESEGYGLVLLEAMYAGMDWISRDIAAGHDLGVLGFGDTYSTKEELVNILKNYNREERRAIRENYKYYIKANHLISHMVEDILRGAGL